MLIIRNEVFEIRNNVAFNDRIQLKFFIIQRIKILHIFDLIYKIVYHYKYNIYLIQIIIIKINAFSYLYSKTYVSCTLFIL